MTAAIPSNAVLQQIPIADLLLMAESLKVRSTLPYNPSRQDIIKAIRRVAPVPPSSNLLGAIETAALEVLQ